MQHAAFNAIYVLFIFRFSTCFFDHYMVATDSHEANTPSIASISLGGFANGDMITKPELCKCLNCPERTLLCMVKRFGIPPGMTLGGCKVWIVGKIRAWFVNAAERRETEALKEARRLRIYDT